MSSEKHGQFTGAIKPVLYVSDARRAGAFYRDVLGFEKLSAEDDPATYYVEMAAGSQKFGLHEPQSPADEARVGRQRLYFRVRDLDAHRERIEARGGSPDTIVDTDWMRMFVTGDPDGHEIVFAVTDPTLHSVDPW